ncbi:MAG TPA: DoxX family protein [Gemmatimonadaceae bacterium]|nr:DoxX family protein [Gemmatimonadaceae bacterium]
MTEATRRAGPAIRYQAPTRTRTAEYGSRITAAVEPAAASLASVTHALLRAGAGVLFLQHGLQKVFGLLGGFMGTPGATAPLMSQMGLAGVLEVVGGTLLILGLFTRPVAVVLMLEMISAYFIAHLPQGGWPIQNGGEPALLFALIFAFFAANGAGRFSLDRFIRWPWRENTA